MDWLDKFEGRPGGESSGGTSGRCSWPGCSPTVVGRELPRMAAGRRTGGKLRMTPPADAGPKVAGTIHTDAVAVRGTGNVMVPEF